MCEYDEATQAVIDNHLAPGVEEFDYKVKRDVGLLGMELQDLTTKFFNSVLYQTPMGKAITDDLLGALRQIESYREIL